MEGYKTVRTPVRAAAPLDVSIGGSEPVKTGSGSDSRLLMRMLEKAEALERRHPRLVLAAEAAAILLGFAGMFSMLGGL